MPQDRIHRAPVVEAATDVGARGFVLDQIYGFMTTQLLIAAVRVGLPEALADRSWTVDELAVHLDLNADALRRTVRGLALAGFVAIDGDEIGPGKRLHMLQPRPGSLRDVVLHFGEEAYQTFAELSHTLETGAPAFDRVHGAPFFDYLRANPEAGAAFNGTMVWLSEPVSAALADAYADVDFRVTVDVGGGWGHLAAALLERRPDATGVVMDRSALEAEAVRYLKERGLAERCRFVGGNFFKSVPADGDLYLLKSILHDWPDDACITLLQNCRYAMTPGGRLLVIERPIPESGPLSDDDPDCADTIYSDLYTLVSAGVNAARERSAAEYAAMLSDAGFAVARTLPLAEGFTAVEAVPQH